MQNEELVQAIKQGDNVEENILQLYNQNLPLIKQTCSKYSSMESLEDLLQIAFMSLYESTKRYNESKGCKYITYCLLWVKQFIRRYLVDCGRTIRLPDYQEQQLYKYKRFMNDFEIVNGRTPTNDEVLQGLNIYNDELIILKTYSSELKSLDEMIETDSDSFSLLDNVASPEDLENECIDSIYYDFEKRELWAIVDNVLIESQADVIKERYQNNQSYRAIAEKKGFSLERARQLEHEAFRKLKFQIKKLNLLDLDNYIAFSGTVGRFRSHNFTSCVEELAIRRTESKQYYLEALQGYEERKAETQRAKIS